MQTYQVFHSLCTGIKFIVETMHRIEGTHAVSSWPPPWKPVLQKIPAGLPARAWDAHSSCVASKNALNCAAITPNRDGNPKTNPSASGSCSGLISDTSFALGGAFTFFNIKSESVSGTCYHSKKEMTIVSRESFPCKYHNPPRQLLYWNNLPESCFNTRNCISSSLHCPCHSLHMPV